MSEHLALLLRLELWPFFRFIAVLLCRSCWYRWFGKLPRTQGRPKQLPPAASIEQVFPPTSHDSAGVTHGSYRIPSLLRLGEPFRHVVLAFAEGRDATKSDWGCIEVVLRHSEDGGCSWSPVRVVLSSKDVGLEGATVGNPCTCWDALRQRVVLLVTVTEAGAPEPAVWCQVAPRRRVFTTWSVDGGISWKSPREVTSEVTQDDWTWYATGPGRAIQLQAGDSSGRLVVPCDHVLTSKSRCCTSFLLRSHVLLSDDGGDSWRVGGCGVAGTNESQVAELPGGQLLLNMRDFTGRCIRRTATSVDGGETFGDNGYNMELPEPRPTGCQASILAVRNESQQPVANARILFSGPADVSGGRRDLLVRASCDGGSTWPSAVSVHAGPAAYSCLAILGTREMPEVGVLYEGGLGADDPYEAIFLCRFPLMTLSEGE